MTEPKKHVYESETLGVPALKMVLVHAKSEAQRGGARRRAAAQAALSEEEAAARENVVRRIIERLQEPD